eukprot:PhM_4_TR2930/c0_g1_i1/m.89756
MCLFSSCVVVFHSFYLLNQSMGVIAADLVPLIIGLRSAALLTFLTEGKVRRTTRNTFPVARPLRVEGFVAAATTTTAHHATATATTTAATEAASTVATVTEATSTTAETTAATPATAAAATTTTLHDHVVSAVVVATVTTAAKVTAAASAGRAVLARAALLALHTTGKIHVPTVSAVPVSDYGSVARTRAAAVQTHTATSKVVGATLLVAADPIPGAAATTSATTAAPLTTTTELTRTIKGGHVVLTFGPWTAALFAHVTESEVQHAALGARPVPSTTFAATGLLTGATRALQCLAVESEVADTAGAAEEHTERQNRRAGYHAQRQAGLECDARNDTRACGGYDGRRHRRKTRDTTAKQHVENRKNMEPFQ